MSDRMPTEPFVVPPYPYDRLDEVIAIAAKLDGGAVDLSIGTPIDPPMPEVLEALARAEGVRGYPSSIGSPALRRAISGWFTRRLGVSVDADTEVGACVGTKEFVASLPQYLRLRDPARDTILYPAISYPTYEMGATLGGCRAVAYQDLADISAADAARALAIWVNSPSNPTGAVSDLAAAARWGRERAVLVVSDECYVDYTWTGAPSTILADGPSGVLAVHSLSKRDNFAGARIGFYAGDAELVHYLQEIRKHAGLMVPGPVQAAAVVALSDDAHVEVQRARYLTRLKAAKDLLAAAGYPTQLPDGTFYLWVAAPDGDAWAAAYDLAERAGIVVSPGDFYGNVSANFFRVAVVQPDDRIALAAARLS
jgi:succinyldiaminopimelate transaminase